MAKKQEWTVRVVNWHDKIANGRRVLGTNELPGLWVEQLRYMGHAKELASYDDRTVVEFYCPNPTKLDSRIWADQNAARMRSFGIDAAAAPIWHSYDGRPDDRGAASYNLAPERVTEYMERLNRPKS